jgi:hypothetical protein
MDIKDIPKTWLSGPTPPRPRPDKAKSDKRHLAYIRSWSDELCEQAVAYASAYTDKILVIERYARSLVRVDAVFSGTDQSGPSNLTLPFLTRTIRYDLVKLILERIGTGAYPSPIGISEAKLLLTAVRESGCDTLNQDAEIEIIKYCSPNDTITYLLGKADLFVNSTTVLNAVLDLRFAENPEWARQRPNKSAHTSRMNVSVEKLLYDRMPGIAWHRSLSNSANAYVQKRLQEDCGDPVIARTFFEDQRTSTRLITLNEFCERARALVRATTHAPAPTN